MVEKVQQQIETATVEALKGPKELAKYRADFLKTANQAKSELDAATIHLKTDEANSFMKKSVDGINQYLREIATHGQEIQKKHEASQNIETSEFQPLEKLDASLKAELTALQNGLGDFNAMAGHEKSTEEIAARVTKLDTDINPANTSNSLSEIQSMKGSLDQTLSGLPKSEVTGNFRMKIEKRIGELKNSLEIKEQTINAFAKDKTKVDEMNKGVGAYEAAAKDYEKDPAPEALAKVRALETALDPAKLGGEIFDPVLGKEESGALKVNLYQALWSNEYSEGRRKFDAVKAVADAKESETVSGLAEKMLADVALNEKDVLEPKWREYEPLSRMTAVEEKNKQNFLSLEEGLLSGLLVLKSAVNGFNMGGTPNKLNGDVLGKVAKKNEDITVKIRQIEVNRQTRVSRDNLFSARNLSSYVDFPGEEKDGKIYRFNAAFDQLPPERKDEIRAAVETVIAHDKTDVQKQTAESEQRLAKSSGNFEQMEKALGEKSKNYVAGLKLMTQGKFAEALSSFKAFLNTAISFSPEERAKLEGAVYDATGKVSLMEKSGDYFDALNKLKGNDPDAAADLIKKYLDGVQSLGPEAGKQHAEQIGSAREILKMIGNQNIRLLQDLHTDVRKWKESKINEQIDKKGVVHEVEVAGPEVGMIEQQIGALQERINNGEIVNFHDEFAKIKTNVKEFLQKNAANPRDNLIDKLSELYESLSGKDPAVRRKALISFAQECRDAKGYDMARKYLDKALTNEYEQASREVSRESVMRRMMDDPKIMTDIRAQAQTVFDRMKTENPAMAGVMTFEKAMQMVFERKLGQQYNRELRHQMTDRGMAKGNDALNLYNEWSPHEAREHWYEFGKTYNAEDWDAWKAEAYEFAAMTAATLPIGMVAGTVGRGIGGLALRQAGGALLRGSAEVAARDAALAAIERGGLLALRPGSAAFRVLEPAAQEFIMQNQSRLALAGAARLAGGLAVEGATLYGGNVLAEGMVAGRAAEMTWGSVFESVVKAGVFRGIGLGGHGIFGKAMVGGGAKSAGALAGMEAFSGAMGTTVEAATMYLSGNTSQIDSAFILKSLLQNAVSSVGMHVGEGVIRLPESGATARSEKLKGRMEKAGREHEESQREKIAKKETGAETEPVAGQKAVQVAEVISLEEARRAREKAPATKLKNEAPGMRLAAGAEEQAPSRERKRPALRIVRGTEEASNVAEHAALTGRACKENLRVYLAVKFDGFERTVQARMKKEYQRAVDVIASPKVQRDLNRIFADMEGVDAHALHRLRTYTEELALEQQFNNPEKYVSHGFDHSLNVTRYMESVMKDSPEMVKSMETKYGISKPEAELMLRLMAVYHDFGYPDIQEGLGKALHGVTGAAIVASDKFKAIMIGVIKSKGADFSQLMYDFKKGILYHSADKVEVFRDAKIKIAHGEFIIDADNIVDVYMEFRQKEGRAGRKILIRCSEEIEKKMRTKLETGSTAMKPADIEREFDFQRPEKSEIATEGEHKGKFRGRKVDLKAENDAMLGIHYREVNSADDPLNFAIRLTDNMDMTAERFSRIQQAPIFREIYQLFAPMEGQNPPTGKLMAELEDCKKGKVKMEDIVADPEFSNILKKYQVDTQTDVATVIKSYKKKLIEKLMSDPKHQADVAEFGEKILKIGSAQSSESVRHFGGCESVKDMKFSNNVLTITVKRARFDELNRTQVTEKSFKADGSTEDVRVGIGEYQIWRAYEAYRSLQINGESLRVVVVDENGHTVVANTTEHFQPLKS